MSKFYEILKKLREPKREKPKKVTFKKITYLLLGIIFLSGIGVSLVGYYVKTKVSPSKTYLVLNNQSSNLSNPTIISNISAPSITPSINQTKVPSMKPLLKKTQAFSPKKFSFVNSSFTPSTSIPTSNANFVFEKTDFLLSKEDLLNNLLILAEEERKRGNLEKAIFYYQSYLKERENPSVMNNYGACLIDLGKVDEAITILSKARSFRNDPEIHYNLVIAYFKKGEKEQACKELKNLRVNFLLGDNLTKLKELCE